MWETLEDKGLFSSIDKLKERKMYRFKKDTYETSQHIKMYGPYLDVISTNYKLKKKL